MLIFRVITFELTQPIQPRYIDVTDEQTDGRTATPRFTLHRALKMLQFF